MSTERATPNTPEWAALAPHHLARYLFAAELAAGKRVLDAGTGAGYGAALLQNAGAQEVRAIDIDAASIAAAQQSFPLPNLTFLTDDCHTLAHITGPFDLITNFENIEHLPHPEKFLARAAELLGGGGTLLISTPDRANTPPFINGKPANPYHHHEWTRDEFLSLLSPHFKYIDMRIQVQSHALASRLTAVDSLRQGLSWSNPVATFLWRKLARTNPSPTTRSTRSYKSLEALAAPTPADYPIVTPALAAIHGTPYCHFALCKTQPSSQPL